jgi:Prokaryotic N-terminal methylation motif
MPKTKIKSFTLPELLVVMVITVIVVGLAFSVLRLVQKEIYHIQSNFEKTTTLLLFEQKLWQDFNEMHQILYDKQGNELKLMSDLDTAVYHFENDYVLRNKDSVFLKLAVDQVYFEGKKIPSGTIDAILIKASQTLPDYEIFVSKTNDVTLFMNKENGF